MLRGPADALDINCTSGSVLLLLVDVQPTTELPTVYYLGEFTNILLIVVQAVSNIILVQEVII